MVACSALYKGRLIGAARQKLNSNTMRRAAATAFQPPRARRGGGRYHAANLCSSRRTPPAMFMSRGSNSSCTAPGDKANDADHRIPIPGPPEIVGVTRHGPTTTAQPFLQISELQPAAATEETTRSSSRMTVDLERQRATELVDRLLEGTRQLMQQQQQQQSTTATLGTEFVCDHHSIAYSGGVDSSLVAALVYQNVTNTTTTTTTKSIATAVMGISPAVPEEQVDAARRVAETIGIPFVTTPTHEGSQEMYIANEGKACLACKTELYRTLQAVHRHSSSNISRSSSSSVVRLYNGTNADDLQDPTRLGLIAAANFQVASPLRDTPKHEVRLAARHFGLPNWNTAASPCLRSRLALGVPATELHLRRIGAAERFVRQQLLLLGDCGSSSSSSASSSSQGEQQQQQLIDETTNLRVRLLPHQRACLEMDADRLEGAQRVYRNNQQAWDHYFLEELEFASFGMRAFRSGSVATNNKTDEATEQDSVKEACA